MSIKAASTGKLTVMKAVAEKAKADSSSKKKK
jgi:hypothetical protein